MPGRHARLAALAAVVLLVSASAAFAGKPQTPAAFDPARGILIEGATVVTMDDDHTVIPHGRVLVRDGQIVAVWRGPKPPAGVPVGNPVVVEAGPQDLLFPGLINLHDHPNNDLVDAWPAPSSHVLPGKAGTDPYSNRYQWNTTSPPEYRRLVQNAVSGVGDTIGLGHRGEIVKYAEVRAILGGTTSIQGAAPNPESDLLLARNIDNNVFDTRIAAPRVASIGTFTGSALSTLVNRMKNDQVDAWMVHLAEGTDASSRGEFTTLKTKGLLTDMTVVVHGTGLERPDFAEMRAAPTIRTNLTGDGLGAKLVWSPLSNLLLYGKTTKVYDALAEGVLVSLGTDWSPSGSPNLLYELKVADRALRDVRVLGADRALVAAVDVTGKEGHERQLAEAALDQALVDMVTRNPAKTLRWYGRVGSVEAGKLADLVLVHRPAQSPSLGDPPTVYRDLIDSTDRDVALVLIGGEPVAGDVEAMELLKPGDHEVVSSDAGGYAKAIDVTRAMSGPTPVPEGTETFAQLRQQLVDGLHALGGDAPPPGGGPGPASNTYHYLKAYANGGAFAALSDAAFRPLLASVTGTLPGGILNIESEELVPLFPEDQDFLRHLVDGDLDGVTGLIADTTPPFALYPANLNHIGPFGNPLAGLLTP